MTTNDAKPANPAPTEQARVMRGVMFTGTAQVWKIGINFLSSIVLARLLLPTDFGLMAAAAPVINFALLLQNLGLAQAVVQAERLEKHQADALFWLSIVVSLVLALLIVALAPVAASFFKDQRLIEIYMVSAISIILSAASAQPTALLARHLRFGSIAIRDILATGISAAIAIVLALATHSYWALASINITMPFVTLVLSAKAAKWRPGRPRYDDAVKGMIRFGTGVLINNVVSFFARDGSTIIIGRATSTYDLGIYDRAYKLLMYPLTQAVNPVGRVLIPTLSRLRSDGPTYRDTYWHVVGLLLLVIHPGLIVLIVQSRTAIGFLLGEKWLASAVIFAWLGIAGLHQMFTTTVGWLYVSQGRGKNYATLGIVTAAVTVASFLVGIRWGIIGLTIAYTISEYLVRFPYTIWHVGRSGPVTQRNIISNLWPFAAAMIVDWLTIAASSRFLPERSILTLGGLLALSYLLYFIIVALFPKQRALLFATYAKIIALAKQKRAA